jgi:uncharacterized membrane protein
MKTRAELKAKAKESLSGKWGDAIVITIVFLIISSAISVLCSRLFPGENADVYNSTNLIGSLIELVLTGLFAFGYMSFFLKLSRDEDVEVNELWSKTSMIGTFIIAVILISLFTTLWTLLFIIPGIIAAYSYQMTLYILLDNPDMKVMDAIKESKEMMKGHKMEFFILQLSFLGWLILGVFTAGILYLWLIPYMNVTMCNFYNNLKELK